LQEDKKGIGDHVRGVKQSLEMGKLGDRRKMQQEFKKFSQTYDKSDGVGDK